MVSDLPTVAVLLAAYNGMQWIDEQLATIQAQRGVCVHIFISCDPSADGTEEWCANYQKSHQNVKLLQPSITCGGAARNFFHLICQVDLSAFTFVALADQDDLWHPDKLERATQYLSRNSADAYSSNVTAFWPDGRRKVLEKAQSQVRWDHYFEAAGPGCTYVLKVGLAKHLQAQVLRHWSKLQDVTLHDWYIYTLARSHGFRWHIDTVSTMDYRQHARNQVGANVGSGALITRYRQIRSGWWFGQVRLIESIVNHERNPADRPMWYRLSQGDLIRLAWRAHDCRRRTRDQWLFRCLSLLSAAIGEKSHA